MNHSSSKSSSWPLAQSLRSSSTFQLTHSKKKFCFCFRFLFCDSLALVSVSSDILLQYKSVCVWVGKPITLASSDSSLFSYSPFHFRIDLGTVPHDRHTPSAIISLFNPIVFSLPTPSSSSSSSPPSSQSSTLASFHTTTTTNYFHLQPQLQQQLLHTSFSPLNVALNTPIIGGCGGNNSTTTMEPIAELEDDDEEGYTYYSPTLRQQMNKQLQEQQQHFQDSMMERDLVDESSDNGQGGGGRGGGGDGESPSRTMMSSPGEVQFLKLQSQQQHHHHHQQQPRSASANQMMGNGSGSGGGSSQDNLNNLCNNGRGSGNNLSLDESDGSASTGNGVPFRTRSNTWPQQCSAIISLDYDDEGGAVPPTDSTTEMDSGGHGDGARAPPRFESMVSGDSFDQDDEKDGVQLLSHHHGGRPLSTGTSSSNQSSLANLTSLATVTCLHGQHQQQSTTSSSAGHADSNGTPPSSESTPNAEQSFYQMDPFYGHHHLHHHHQEHAHHPQHLSYQQQQQQQQNDMDVPLLVDPIYSHSTPHSSTSSLMHPFGQQQQQQQHNHHHHGDHATPTHDPYQLLTSPLGSSVYGNMFANYSSQQDVAADLVGAAIHHQQQQQQQLLHSDLQMDMMVVEGGVDGGDLVAASQQAEAAVAAAAAMAALKKNTSRRNAWGNMSYADLITQAINGAPDNRLTLSQIYEWMVQNVAYFKDKGDSNSSAGWKVSVWLSRKYRVFGTYTPWNNNSFLH